MEIKEVWKDIEGYEGFYKISNLGRVKSLPRNGTIRKEKILSNKLEKNGYYTICLHRLGDKKFKKIHRLIAIAFIKKIEGKNIINHLDGNRGNNSIENLEWCTQKENIIHSWDMGFSKVNIEQITKARENSNISCRKKVAKFSLDGTELARFDSMTDARKSIGKASSSLIAMSCREGKKAYGFRWRYL